MKKTTLLPLIILFLFPALTFAGAKTTYRSASGEVIEALPQVLVRYKEGRAAAAQGAMMKSFRAAPKRKLKSIGVDVIPVPSGMTLQSFLDQLKKNPDIEFAEPNGVLRAIAFPQDTPPNDPDYSSQYGLGFNYINMEEAWPITIGVSTVVVAVIDTGITATHEDLIGNIWPSTGTRLELDWNGDGDCNADVDPDFGPDQCAGSDPTDDNTGEHHGTRVSGIIAATTNNGTDMAGVAPNCKIMAIKALNASGFGTFEAIAAGVDFAVANGASVINMSLGGTTASNAVATAIQAAIDANIVVVAAAGNAGNAVPVNFPASIPKVIAVGATDSTNTLAFFSCTGNTLDLVAPGVGILSTIPPNNTSSSGGDGTSFSAPMVAGVAALIRSIDSTFTIDEVTRYIDFTATDIGPAGFDNGYGFGLLNAARAVQSAQARTIFYSNPAQPSETFPYPNPFRPATGESTTISIPSSLGNSGIEIKFMNAAGERVRTLTDTAIWDGRNDDGSYVASGIYFYFVKTTRGDTKGKVTVIK